MSVALSRCQTLPDRVLIANGFTTAGEFLGAIASRNSFGSFMSNNTEPSTRGYDLENYFA